MNSIYVKIFTYLCLLKIRTLYAEPYFGQLTFPYVENYNISLTAYQTTIKIYNIIELTRPCSYSSEQSNSRFIQIGIGACKSFFNSLDKNVGTWSGPYSELTRMAIDVFTDGRCLMSNFVENLNKFNTFSASLYGIIPYFEVYVNNAVGKGLTQTFKDISTEMDALYKTVQQITDETSRASADSSTNVDLFRLSPQMQSYTEDLKTELQTFLALWTNAEAIFQELIPSIRTNKDVFERVTDVMNSRRPTSNYSMEYFVRLADSIRDSNTALVIRSTQSVVDRFSEAFSKILDVLYSDDIVKRSWENRQRALFNRNIRQIKEQLYTVRTYTSDSNYLFTFDIVTEYEKVFTDIVDDVYTFLRSLTNGVNTYLSDATQCAQTASWSMVFHIIEYFNRFYNCPTQRITRLFNLYPQVASTLNKFQSLFIQNIYFDGLPCLFGSNNRGNVRSRRRVSNCIDVIIENLASVVDQFFKNVNESNVHFTEDTGIIYSECSLCFNQTRRFGLANLRSINGTFKACYRK